MAESRKALPMMLYESRKAKASAWCLYVCLSDSSDIIYSKWLNRGQPAYVTALLPGSRYVAIYYAFSEISRKPSHFISNGCIVMAFVERAVFFCPPLSVNLILSTAVVCRTSSPNALYAELPYFPGRPHWWSVVLLYSAINCAITAHTNADAHITNDLGHSPPSSI